MVYQRGRIAQRESGRKSQEHVQFVHFPSGTSFSHITRWYASRYGGGIGKRKSN